MAFVVPGWKAVVLSALIRVSVSFVKRVHPEFAASNVEWILLLNVIGLILALEFLVLNMAFSRGMGLVILGFAMNMIAIISNAGRMPVSIYYEGMFYSSDNLPLLISGGLPFHKALSDSTIFPYFADVIPFTRPSLFPSVLSVGDVLIFIGFIVVVIEVVGRVKKYLATPE